MWCIAVDRFADDPESGAEPAHPQTYALPPRNISRRETFGITRGEKTLRVRLFFEPTVAVHLMERDWYPSQTFTRHPDGHVEIRLGISGRKKILPLGAVLDAGCTDPVAE